MTLAIFASVLVLHFLAAMSPGPSFVVSVRTAVTRGFDQAVALALGIGLGSAVWAFAALAGLALLFEIAPATLTILRLAGAGYLVWLALTVWRNANKPLPPPDTAPSASGIAGSVRLGFVTQIANPKPAIFFGAIFVGVVPTGSPAYWYAALIFMIFVNETLWYVVVARVFSAEPARNSYARLKLWIDRLFAGLIATFGLKIAIG